MDGYTSARDRWPMTADAREKAAAVLAEACSGGKWATHFTEEQKDLWRRRLDAALAVER